ncbi:MarR family winged helix-turn-helix transcriptional regulator [Paracoccus benzoatiresistens]|uniref:MarR family transcriptional regulator n=1 Tax=Paracoccus benzoatiresistens TaxID=2997341 RepID=A0ABT4J259_9RHOB|nr:MarR family transcriptional regulator [Paracoccus sp. EF6]MCZ0960740.1 MarR family transcriptional regulator [Paracoccus sp. EF6]
MVARDLEGFAPYMLNRIMARYNAGVAEILAPEGVSVPQMRALAVLAAYGPRTVNELSVLTVIKQSTLSRTLDSMEAAGLIRREPCEKDSRVRLVHLTEAGAALHDRAWPAMREAEERLFAAIPHAERAAFTATLGRILRSIRHHDF